MKVYGESWDLPEAPKIEHPFMKYIVMGEKSVVEAPRPVKPKIVKSPSPVLVPEENCTT